VNTLSNPVVMVIVLGALSLAPFVLIMLTSFVKISVVLSILRNALGTQQVPPNQVITGLSFVLTLFVMSPVAERMYEAAGAVPNTANIFSEASVKTLFDSAQRGKEPLRRFLAQHAHAKDRLLFMELAARLDQQSRQTLAAKPVAPAKPVEPPKPVDAAKPVDPAKPATTGPAKPAEPPAPAKTTTVEKDDFRVLIPSFVTSELKSAFQIGFLVFLPFLVIDMVVANILLSMGMSMLSPSVISLPFKLLLFVLMDGWFLLVRGLVLTYAG
jgi:type III secretion protein R